MIVNLVNTFYTHRTKRVIEKLHRGLMKHGYTVLHRKKDGQKSSAAFQIAVGKESMNFFAELRASLIPTFFLGTHGLLTYKEFRPIKFYHLSNLDDYNYLHGNFSSERFDSFSLPKYKWRDNANRYYTDIESFKGDEHLRHLEKTIVTTKNLLRS